MWLLKSMFIAWNPTPGKGSKTSKGIYRVFGNFVFSNGALCWLMRNDLDEKGYVVLNLDTSTKKFHQFSIPTPADDYSKLNLEVLGDSLYICVHHSQSPNDFCIMKEYRVSESWTLLYFIRGELSLGCFLTAKLWFVQRMAKWFFWSQMTSPIGLLGLI